MKKIALILIFALGMITQQGIAQSKATKTEGKECCSKSKDMDKMIYGFKMETLSGEELSLDNLRGNWY
jgi:hypothetical protein